MSVIKVNNITNRDGTSGPVIAGITTVSSTSHMVVPTGNTGQKVALAPDPYINNLVLALPFNSESVFDDVSPRGKGTPSIYGMSKTSSLPFGVTGVTTTSSGIVTFSKYYGTSVYFDGIDDYLTIPPTSDITLEGSDFTIEFWINPLSSTGGEFFYWNANSSAFGLRLNIFSGVINFLVSIDGTSHAINTSLTTLSANVWTHLAISRYRNTLDLYQNGIRIYNNTSFTGAITAGTNNVIGARTFAPDYKECYLQDLRIYKGVAKYTSNFTPPTQIAL